ncbi:WD domain, G-beta repeat containing protein [Entamoeba histolytica HM-1:IMSS-B]|uniref:WD domain containing protein n=6 Tax=Entamoeba histolytica TaxID=5759 RepID=C4LYG9_ENTH1|nr:WD domain containing protein [Entamoeba histolytica HM-1:IMSS]EMD48777.1 WD repeatcontaining protein 40A-B [Entamoeba histolytica KU27]EMH76766.1 WD domain, G-beta repeat containing protein [Entamoeba histolytica HM-1:IMSS-B]EMS11809.1 WD repeat-containing protein 40A-B, putative [Entamoeba histolytica HM-3:IMSS]ENY63252.1 WD repeat-containing protein 40A-B [Entamoeba histolytica HM-1:IMSS-A]GAT93865.1 WD domain containing protein [Entamoeba histolytica]|eukprot:XP_657294.1 WD domain containing protein [Entamoeba histolytica HM-1:IMSS]
MLGAIQQRNRNTRYFGISIECEKVFETRIPNFFSTEQIQYPPSDCDKIFASCWINEDTVVLGSKDNQLIVWNVYEKTIKKLKLPNTVINFDRGSGIHDVDYYPSGDSGLLASGSDSPNDIVIFDTILLSPIALLRGHSDWVFGSKFIDEDVLFSGGRDGKLCFWKMDKKPSYYNTYPTNKVHIEQPFFERTIPEVKIRCVGIQRMKKICYALTSEGTVGMWDAELMEPIHDEQLEDSYELVTMDVKQDGNVIAVGSRSFTTILDPRDKNEVVIIGHVDVNWGVRSVLFLDNYLVIGGGSGSVSFVDMRKPGNYKHTIYHKCSGTVRNTFPDMNETDIPQAVYTISSNPSKTNLFVGGGPLLVGVSGYFGSVWN